MVVVRERSGGGREDEGAVGSSIVIWTTGTSLVIRMRSVQAPRLELPYATLLFPTHVSTLLHEDDGLR